MWLLESGRRQVGLAALGALGASSREVDQRVLSALVRLETRT